jgi:hypothetical protein
MRTSPLIAPLALLSSGLSMADEKQPVKKAERSLGEAMARANSYAKRFEGARVWEGKHWEKALFISDTDQDLDTHTQLDERASWFYEAIGVTDGMMGKIVGAGWLDGGENYKLTVPGPVLPASNKP